MYLCFRYVFHVSSFLFITLKTFIKSIQHFRTNISRQGWLFPHVYSPKYTLNASPSSYIDNKIGVIDECTLEDNLIDFSKNNQKISVKDHFNNLLNAKIAIEPMIAKKRKVESIQLTYDTKREPFRHVSENECAIPNFSNVWNAIVEMRKNKDAPVDTMGAHCLADEGADPAVYQYQTLIACMLSSQTKDSVTASAMENLKKRGLTIDTILKMPEDELDSLISKVGFHKTKAKNIKEATLILHEHFSDKVPDTLDELTSLPGVGPKMANLILQLAFKRINGIAVDLHVHRISNRLGWVHTKTPEETRIKLEELLPKKLWAEVNHLIVGFGQTICTAAGPGCATCGANKWCPTGISNLSRSKV